MVLNWNIDKQGSCVPESRHCDNKCPNGRFRCGSKCLNPKQVIRICRQISNLNLQLSQFSENAPTQVWPKGIHTYHSHLQVVYFN